MSSSLWRTAPVLGVSNVRAAAEYYRDVLGFTLDPVSGVFAPSPAEPSGVYAIVERSGLMVHFQIRRDERHERNRSALERDVYCYVSDVDALYAELTTRGANIFAPLHLAPHGLREFVIEDPNGYRVTFGQRD